MNIPSVRRCSSFCFAALIVMMVMAVVNIHREPSSEKTPSSSDGQLLPVDCGGSAGPSSTHDHVLKCVLRRSSDHDQYTADTIAHNLSTECPCAYDSHGKCHQQPHMCSATKQSFYCKFTLHNVLVTGTGGLIDCASLTPISFAHRSMGKGDPTYYEGTYNKWVNNYVNASRTFLQGPFIKLKATGKAVSLPTYDLVVPTRMLWDTKFTHLSFQAVPFIALVHLAYGHTPLWSELTWHASTATAALLMLLDIPRERIVTRAVRAKRLVMPWIPHWSPPQVAVWRGLAADITRIITHRLVTGPFTEYAYCDDTCRHTGRLTPRNATKPLVVYLSRPPTATRYVTNEADLIEAIRATLHPTLELAIIDSTVEHHKIKRMHMAWVHYASAMERARVVISPHGGSFNNLMFAAQDADYIEFNEFPDSSPSAGAASSGVSDSGSSSADGVSARGGHARNQRARPGAGAGPQPGPEPVPVRYCFLNAAWAKGGSGRFWIVRPTRKASNFYEGSMRVSVRDVLSVLGRLGLLRAGADLSGYPTEPSSAYTTWQANDSRATTYNNRMNSGSKIFYRTTGHRKSAAH